MHMSSALAGSSSGTHDPAYEQIVVIFNCAPVPINMPWPQGVTGPLVLHPALHDALRYDARIAECTTDEKTRKLQVRMVLGQECSVRAAVH